VSVWTDFLKMFTPEDAEVVKKTLARIDEQDRWNDVFSTKLIELLDNIDGLKKEIRERMRRVESIKFAESVLLDEASKTENLNLKLAETEKALEALRREFQAAKLQYTGAGRLRNEARESLAQAEARYGEAKGSADEAERAYRISEHAGKSSVNAYKESERQLLRASHELREAAKSSTEAAASFSSASQLLARSEEAQERASRAALVAKSLLDRSASQLNDARSAEERAAGDLNFARENTASSQQRLTMASELFQRATRWAVAASVLSWIAAAWMVWSALHLVVPVWEPSLATVILAFAGIFVLNGVKHEA
jgi:hypothetical protein